MKTIYHPSDSRGYANHGWLKTHHTFSFANYYNPERMHFGRLRVLNDDEVAEGKGFGTHPHDNMEIITIPLEGDLEHRDSMGNGGIIKYGDVQVMSAGTGITHSEFNANKDRSVKLLQIWVFPNKKQVTPRYDQLHIANYAVKNQFQQIVSPNPDDDGVWIHQDAWFSLADLDKGVSKTYNLKKEENGVYLFVIKGKIKVGDQLLESRDGLGTWETNQLTIETHEDSTVLLMEVPMI